MRKVLDQTTLSVVGARADSADLAGRTSRLTSPGLGGQRHTNRRFGSSTNRGQGRQIRLRRQVVAGDLARATPWNPKPVAGTLSPRGGVRRSERSS